MIKDNIIFTSLRVYSKGGSPRHYEKLHGLSCKCKSGGIDSGWGRKEKTARQLFSFAWKMFYDFFSVFPKTVDFCILSCSSNGGVSESVGRAEEEEEVVTDLHYSCSSHSLLPWNCPSLFLNGFFQRFLIQCWIISRNKKGQPKAVKQ